MFHKKKLESYVPSGVCRSSLEEDSLYINIHIYVIHSLM